MSATVSREQLLEAVRTLGLDPNCVHELHIYPDYVTGSEIVKTLDGTDNKIGNVSMQSGELPKRDFHMQVKGDK